MVAASKPPFNTVRIARKSPDDAAYNDILDIAEAFIPRPHGYIANTASGKPIGPKLDPDSIYLVTEPLGPGDLSVRVADALSHETLHHVLKHTEDMDTSAKLDRPFEKRRKLFLQPRIRGGI